MRVSKWLVITYLWGVHGRYADVDRTFVQFCDGLLLGRKRQRWQVWHEKVKGFVLFGFEDVRTPAARGSFGVFAPFWLVGTCRNLNGPRQPKPGVW